MIYNPHIRLSTNFYLYEAIEWGKLLGQSKKDQDLSMRYALDSLTDQVFANICFQASRMQQLRDTLNEIYPEHNVRIRITSWLRGQKWELYKGRDGSSQHTKGLATDYIIMGLPKELQKEAKAFSETYFTDGKTIPYETFTHNDCRGLM